MSSHPRRSHVLPYSVPFVIAITLATACEPNDPTSAAPDRTTTFDTIAGVIHVTNTGTPPAWQLTPVVSIGPRAVTEEETPDEFGRVSAVALGPDGAVFVADAANSEVRVFGLDGAHIRSFGRAGEGPGEFSDLSSIAWIGDRLLTFDPRLGRIGELSAEGEWLGQRRTPGSGSVYHIRLYHSRLYPVGPNEAFRFAPSPDRESIWVGLDSRGDTGDTVPLLTQGEDRPGMIETIVCNWDGGLGIYPHTVAAKFLQHPASGGVMYSAWGYFYSVAVTGNDGDTLRVIGRTLPAEPVSDEKWAAGRAAFEEARERFQFSDADCNPGSYSRPARSAFINEIFVSPDGKLWVDVIRNAGNRWEFFDTEGRLLGSVPAVPYKERTVPVFRGDHVVTIRQDDLDLDHVDVWRLERVGRHGLGETGDMKPVRARSGSP